MTVPIRLELADENYRKLERVATKRGINAHTLIEQLISHALAPLRDEPGRAELGPRDREAIVLAGYMAGDDDSTIADSASISVGAVRKIRQRLELPRATTTTRKAS